MMDREEMHTLLIVDDTPDNIKILMETLKDEYKIVAATSGARALEVAASKEHRPDLILLDIMMPGIDGYEVCRQLKENDNTRNIPVIFVTAVSEVMDETKGFRLGAVDYITKPFHPPIVKARVQAHINLKVKTDMLEQLASLDGLTNIPNRRKLDEMIVQEFKRARRYQYPLSVILMDVDQFKQYNDNYGHAIGDTCLKKVVKALQKCLNRPYDFIARYGGEEFVVILSDADSKGAETVGLAMKQAVEDLNIIHEFSPVSDHVTISLGAATIYPKTECESPMEIVMAADKMMYKAKEMGRNQLVSVDFKDV